MKKSKIFKIILFSLLGLSALYCILLPILAETQKWEGSDGFIPWGIIGIALIFLMIFFIFPFSYYNSKENIKAFHNFILRNIKKGIFHKEVLCKLPYELQKIPCKFCPDWLAAYEGQTDGKRTFLGINSEGAIILYEYGKDYGEDAELFEYNDEWTEGYYLNYYEDFKSFDYEAFYEALLKILNINERRQFNEEEKALLEQAYSLSFTNKILINDETLCGCFTCGGIFKGSEIRDWMEGIVDNTAICPYCQSLTIIMEEAGFVINKTLLLNMNECYLRNKEGSFRLHSIYTGLIPHID